MASKLVSALAPFFPPITIGGEDQPLLFQTVAVRSREAEQTPTPYCVYQLRSVGYRRTFKASKVDSLTMQISILVPSSAYNTENDAIDAVNTLRASVFTALQRKLDVSNIALQEGYNIDNKILSADIAITYRGDNLRSFTEKLIIPDTSGIPETPIRGDNVPTEERVRELIREFIQAGTAIQTSLQWDPDDMRWEAVSDVTTGYFALTQLGTAESLRDAILGALRAGGGHVPPFSNPDITGDPAYSVNVGSVSNVFQDGITIKRISNVWLTEAEPPYIWVLMPSYTGWIQDFTINNGPNSGALFLVDSEVRENLLMINGTSYDARVGRMTLPFDSLGAGAYVALRYARPVSNPTVTIP